MRKALKGRGGKKKIKRAKKNILNGLGAICLGHRKRTKLYANLPKTLAANGQKSVIFNQSQYSLPGNIIVI